MARGVYRLRLQAALVALFFALLVAVAGVTGLKAALSFVFTALALWKLFLPLLLRGYPHLRLTDIFTASVFVACSGAMMDMAMDIAAAMDEIKQKHPDIAPLEHFLSGLRVGRAVTGTMTTTLLLAYAGSHIAMFLVFVAKGLPAANLLNAPFVSAEVLNILVGSFGLVTVAPFTALVAAALFRGRRVVVRRTDPALPPEA